MMIRWCGASFLLVAWVYFSSCNNAGNKSSATPLKDTLVMWADTSLRVIVNEQKKAFENIYNTPLLDIRYAQEAEIADKLMRNEISFAILQRHLTNNETAYLKEKEDFLPKQYRLASDAFVLITARGHKGDSISADAIGAYFRSGQTAGFQVVFENNHCQAIPYFKNYFNLTGAQMASAFAKSDLNDLLAYLRKEPGAVGVIPFSYISDLESETTMELLKDLKILAVEHVNGKRKIVVSPSQETIATGEYPFTMPIVLLNCNIETKSGINFVNYIMKPRAQRLFLKCGMVPAIFPAREVHVNTN